MGKKQNRTIAAILGLAGLGGLGWAAHREMNRNKSVTLEAGQITVGGRSYAWKIFTQPDEDGRWLTFWDKRPQGERVAYTIRDGDQITQQRGGLPDRASARAAIASALGTSVQNVVASITASNVAPAAADLEAGTINVADTLYQWRIYTVPTRPQGERVAWELKRAEPSQPGGVATDVMEGFADRAGARASLATFLSVPVDQIVQSITSSNVQAGAAAG